MHKERGNFATKRKRTLLEILKCIFGRALVSEYIKNVAGGLNILF